MGEAKTLRFWAKKTLQVALCWQLSASVIAAPQLLVPYQTMSILPGSPAVSQGSMAQLDGAWFT